MKEIEKIALDLRFSVDSSVMKETLETAVRFRQLTLKALQIFTPKEKK